MIKKITGSRIENPATCSMVFAIYKDIAERTCHYHAVNDLVFCHSARVTVVAVVAVVAGVAVVEVPVAAEVPVVDVAVAEVAAVAEVPVVAGSVAVCFAVG